MNKAICWKACALVYYSILVLSSCGTYFQVKRLSPNVYPSTTECQVFMTDKPTREYIELAIIEVYEGGDSILIAKREAMKLGADGIIFTNQQNYAYVAVAPGVVGAAQKMLFVAIRYKEPQEL